MNDPERLQAISDALARCRALRAIHKSEWSLESVENQLVFLYKVENGEQTNRAKLMEINLGLLSVREISDLDDELRNLLTRVSSFVPYMQSGH